MYNFRNAGVNPDTGLTYQEEYEASLQENESNVNWGAIGSFLGALGSGVINTLYGGTTQTQPEIEEEKVLGIKKQNFNILLGVIIIGGLTATLIYLKRKGKF